MLPLGHRSLTDYHTSPARISIYTRLRQTHRMCNNEQSGKAPRALTSQSPVNGTRKFSLVKIERPGQDAVHNQRLSRPSHAGPQGESTATLTRDSTGRQETEHAKSSELSPILLRRSLSSSNVHDDISALFATSHHPASSHLFHPSSISYQLSSTHHNVNITFNILITAYILNITISKQKYY